MSQVLAMLPADVWILIMNSLDVQELVRMGQTCSAMLALVNQLGYPTYLLRNPRPSYSLSASREYWSAASKVRYNYLTDRSWSFQSTSSTTDEPSSDATLEPTPARSPATNHTGHSRSESFDSANGENRSQFVARPLSRAWSRKEQPTMAISPTRLAVAAGAKITLYRFGCMSKGGAAFTKFGGVQPTIGHETTLDLDEPHVRGRNITSVVFLDDGGRHETLLVAYQEGLVEVISLVLSTINNGHHRGLPSAPSFKRTRLPVFHKSSSRSNNDYVESFSTAGSHGQHILSVSADGEATLMESMQQRGSGGTEQTQGVPSLSSRATLGVTKAWTSYLSMSSAPFAAFGASSRTPLTVHSISESGLSPSPQWVLHTKRGAAKVAENLDTNSLPSSAVYALAPAPPQSPIGNSPQILLSGWFDGVVRIYDLRVAGQQVTTRPSSASSSNTGSFSATAPSLDSSAGGGSATLLTPVLSLRDRFSPDPIYSLATGGGGGAHVGAGTARGGVVAFWDLRSPKFNLGYAGSGRSTGLEKAFGSLAVHDSGSDSVSATMSQNTGSSVVGPRERRNGEADLRNVGEGWSVHAPGNDRSPVFSLIMESSRVFGATERRAFIYDFGPNPSLDAFPPLTSRAMQTADRDRAQVAREGLKYKPGILSYKAVKYTHAASGLTTF